MSHLCLTGLHNLTGGDRLVETEDIRQAAEELVDRYGTHALSVARERAQLLSRSEDQKAANVAMRVLTEVERLAADKLEGL